MMNIEKEVREIEKRGKGPGIEFGGKCDIAVTRTTDGGRREVTHQPQKTLMNQRPISLNCGKRRGV